MNPNGCVRLPGDPYPRPNPYPIPNPYPRY